VKIISHLPKTIQWLLFGCIIFKGCNGENIGFDLSRIPGNYNGLYQYFTYEIGSCGRLDTIPSPPPLYMEERKFTITQHDNGIYNLAVDSVNIPPKPLIDFKVERYKNDWRLEIIYLDSDPNFTGYIEACNNNTDSFTPPTNYIYYQEDGNITGFL